MIVLKEKLYKVNMAALCSEHTYTKQKGYILKPDFYHVVFYRERERASSGSVLVSHGL